MAKQATVFSLEERLEALKKERGDQVAVKDIGCVVSSLVSASIEDEYNPDFNEELRDLIAFISSAKNELLKMRPAAIAQNDIPDANEQLNAVVNATEGAADTIMDAAENISEIAATLDEKSAEKLEEISVKLFEASSFQDLTGQRITKVSATLGHIEKRLIALASAMGDLPNMTAAENEFSENDVDLLNGPQLEGKGNTQEDIDAILASFD